MKPTDKEYIEAACIKATEGMYIDKISVMAGYQLALEHTNHAELVEAIKNANR